MSDTQTLSDYEQQMLAYQARQLGVLRDILGLFRRQAEQTTLAQPGQSQAGNAIRRCLDRLVDEPGRPGEMGAIRVRAWQVRKEFKGDGLILDLFAEGIQYEQYAFLSVVEAEWSNPVLVPAALKPETFEDGSEGRCRGWAVYQVSRDGKKNKEGNFYKNVVAFDLAPSGQPLPPLDWYRAGPDGPAQSAPPAQPERSTLEEQPAPTPSTNSGTAGKSAKRTPPTTDTTLPSGNGNGRGDRLAYWRGRGKITLTVKQQSDLKPPDIWARLVEMEAAGEINAGMGDEEIADRVLGLVPA